LILVGFRGVGKSRRMSVAAAALRATEPQISPGQQRSSIWRSRRGRVAASTALFSIWVDQRIIGSG